MHIKPIEDNNSDFGKVFISTTHKLVNATPHCKEHGAMNKVSVFDGGGYWRCCTTERLICRAGCIEVNVTK